MDIKNSCAFTGHRPAHFQFKYNENHSDCIALKNAMQPHISALIETGVTTFYSGMALGVDTWAMELVLELRKRNPALTTIAVLPCETQPDKWLTKQKERYFNLLEQCDDVVYIRRQYTSTCMFDRNRYMVDHAQHLIAVYSGQYKGGTAFTVRYARQNSRDVIIIPTSKLQS